MRDTLLLNRLINAILPFCITCNLYGVIKYDYVALQQVEK